MDGRRQAAVTGTADKTDATATSSFLSRCLSSLPWQHYGRTVTAVVMEF